MKNDEIRFLTGRKYWIGDRSLNPLGLPTEQELIKALRYANEEKDVIIERLCRRLEAAERGVKDE